MTSTDFDDYTLEEESEASPPMSLSQHLYQSPPAAAVAPPPLARLPAASTRADNDKQPGPRFKDQIRPAPPLQSATAPRVIREATIPMASALLVPESQIEREHRVQSEMERQLDLERQQLELERQRLELVERQQQLHQNDQSVSKKRWIGGMVLVVVLVVLVAGVAGFCVSGNCRGSSPSPSTVATEGTSPTMAIAVPVSTSPTFITSEVPFPNQANVPSASVAPDITSQVVPSVVIRTSPPSIQPVPVSVSTPSTIDIPTDPQPLQPTQQAPGMSTIPPVLSMPILRPMPAPTARPQLVPIPTRRPILPPTARPQIVPSSRANAIRSYINSITLTGRSLRYPSSATVEERALLWLIDDDLFTTESETIALRQRYALSTLWFQTTTGFGNSGWATDITECNWFGVDCDAAGRLVKSLILFADGVEGHIPIDLGLLTDLTFLDLESNSLTGTIPSSLGDLTALTFLGLWNNELIGTIPLSIGSLTALTALSLWGNALNGTIPSTIGSLTALTGLYLDGNELNGTIPTSTASLTDLTYFHVYNNELLGTMPLCDSVSNPSLIALVADCDKVSCPCCTHCCPTSRDRIPVYEFC